MEDLHDQGKSYRHVARARLAPHGGLVLDIAGVPVRRKRHAQGLLETAGAGHRLAAGAQPASRLLSSTDKKQACTYIEKKKKSQPRWLKNRVSGAAYISSYTRARTENTSITVPFASSVAVGLVT